MRGTSRNGGGRRGNGKNGKNGQPKPPKGPPGWKRRTFKYMRRIFYVVLVVVLVWSAVAFMSFRSGVQEANERVPDDVARVLSPTNGPAISTARNTLVIGSDVGSTRKLATPDDPGRSDTLILVRTDPASRRFSMLSIPRDLRAEVPGFGMEKVNSAYSLGGPALTIRTVKNLTGLPVHHYIEVDFDGFKELIDDLGGVTVDNPKAIEAEKFDGRAWRFGKGELNLDGQRALAYARVRKNKLDPTESDITRGQRQQAVINAIADKLASPQSLLKPNEVPKSAVGPITTDASATDLVSFGWAKFWAKPENTLTCRLGGNIDMIGGVSFIVGDEENAATMRMFTGKSQPLRPRTADNPFAPGCTTAEEPAEASKK